MPLQTPYGVLSGVVDHADLQNPTGGQWPHYHIWVTTPAGLYDSAINLKSLTDVKIEYRIRDIGYVVCASILALPDGWTNLGQTSTSGALDYVRHPGLTGYDGWILQTGNNLIQALQYLLSNVQRIHIFGASYSTGQGVHDVHMNQGDPLGSQFAMLDAIWQDGGLLFEYGAPQPHITALQIKFETQSLITDDQGHPIRIIPIPPIYEYIPRWKWPPGDPMSDFERQILVEGGLFEMIRWAGAIHYISGEARDAVTQVLHRQLAERLPEASQKHLHQLGAYVAQMGAALT
jgi:hypothetical protein